jgi:hypothetical protein
MASTEGSTDRVVFVTFCDSGGVIPVSVTLSGSGVTPVFVAFGDRKNPHVGTQIKVVNESPHEHYRVLM